MIDYQLIVLQLNKQIKSATGFPIVETNGTGDQPPYPFGGYTVINPELNTRKIVDGEELTEIVEMMISYTFCALDQFQAMELAKKASTHLRHSATVQKLYDQKITVVDIVGFGNRDNFISIETERRYGFDVRVRVTSKEIKLMDSFDKVTIR